MSMMKGFRKMHEGVDHMAEAYKCFSEGAYLMIKALPSKRSKLHILLDRVLDTIERDEDKLSIPPESLWDNIKEEWHDGLDEMATHITE